MLVDFIRFVNSIVFNNFLFVQKDILLLLRRMSFFRKFDFYKATSGPGIKYCNAFTRREVCVTITE